MNITDVVAACKDTGLDWLEQLLQQMFRPKEDKEDSTKVNVEPPKVLLTACQQIVDCLVENILRLEEASLARGPAGKFEYPFPTWQSGTKNCCSVYSSRWFQNRANGRE